MKFRVILLLVLVALYSCRKKSPYPEFSYTDNGLLYKLESFGDSTRKPHIGEYLDIHISFANMNDSVFLDSKYNFEQGKYVAKVGQQSFKGSFEEYFSEMNVGDSVTFIVSADSVFQNYLQIPIPSFIAKHSMLKIHMRINEAMNELQFEAFKKLLDEQKNDLDIEEHRALSEYIHTHQVHQTPLKSGMYYIPIKEGNGPLPIAGNRVSIRYKGCFIDGKQFDNIYEQTPLEFRVGDEDQVIKGIEIGLSFMKAGGKAKFIIPSHLAFGEQGSSTGIVPPYTTVVYEVELLNIK